MEYTSSVNEKHVTPRWTNRWDAIFKSVSKGGHHYQCQSIPTQQLQDKFQNVSSDDLKKHDCNLSDKQVQSSRSRINKQSK